jgi:hypothetical protein
LIHKCSFCFLFEQLINTEKIRGGKGGLSLSRNA